MHLNWIIFGYIQSFLNISDNKQFTTWLIHRRHFFLFPIIYHIQFEHNFGSEFLEYFTDSIGNFISYFDLAAFSEEKTIRFDRSNKWRIEKNRKKTFIFLFPSQNELSDCFNDQWILNIWKNDKWVYSNPIHLSIPLPFPHTTVCPTNSSWHRFMYNHRWLAWILVNEGRIIIHNKSITKHIKQILLIWLNYMQRKKNRALPFRLNVMGFNEWGKMWREKSLSEKRIE